MEKLISLNDGQSIPRVGLGVWEMRGTGAADNIIDAIDCGYRLIDTAAYYHNEEEVGRAISLCPIPREELIITSKVWPADMTAEGTRHSFMRSLELMKLEYIDIFLLHWPIGDVAASWRVLEGLRDEGLVRSIGVSNFMPAHLDLLMTEARVTPALNQFEFNPGIQQHDTLECCHKLGIVPQAWGPLGKGRALSSPLLSAVAKKHGVSPAQVVLRWELQLGLSVIPKASSKNRLEENFNIFDFEPDADDMAAINALNTGESDRFYPYEFDRERFGEIPASGMKTRD